MYFQARSTTIERQKKKLLVERERGGTRFLRRNGQTLRCYGSLSPLRRKIWAPNFLPFLPLFSYRLFLPSDPSVIFLLTLCPFPRQARLKDPGIVSRIPSLYPQMFSTLFQLFGQTRSNIKCCSNLYFRGKKTSLSFFFSAEEAAAINAPLPPTVHSRSGDF